MMKCFLNNILQNLIITRRETYENKENMGIFKQNAVHYCSLIYHNVCDFYPELQLVT